MHCGIKDQICIRMITLAAFSNQSGGKSGGLRGLETPLGGYIWKDGHCG